MTIDWMNPSDDLVEARRIGYEEGQVSMQEKLDEIEARPQDESIGTPLGRLKALATYVEVHLGHSPYSSVGPERAIIEALETSEAKVKRLRDEIGVCDRCGKPLRVMDSVCWPCQEKMSKARRAKRKRATEATKEKT